MNRTLVALLATIMLGACATPDTPPDANRFQQGRDAYLSGDYGEAFERLIVEAEGGDPRAQYTVGYMYYEGQGVTRDEERALEWIKRAADNGNRNAIQALSRLASMGRNRPTPPEPPD